MRPRLDDALMIERCFVVGIWASTCPSETRTRSSPCGPSLGPTSRHRIDIDRWAVVVVVGWRGTVAMGSSGQEARRAVGCFEAQTNGLRLFPTARAAEPEPQKRGSRRGYFPSLSLTIFDSVRSRTHSATTTRTRPLKSNPGRGESINAVAGHERRVQAPERRDPVSPHHAEPARLR